MASKGERLMADLVYDKLADNDTAFECFDKARHADDMCVGVFDGVCKIAILVGDTEYVFTLDEHKQGEFEIYDNDPTLQIGELVGLQDRCEYADGIKGDLCV